MSRERTTWNREQIKQAAMGRTADPYLMNQDHVKQQPAADAYVNGDPSQWAEDVHPSNKTWEAEYSGGQVKRDEIGMPEMRGDTFNHPEKTASDQDFLLKKANVCIKCARLMLGRKASEQSVEDQSVALMHLPDTELVNTFVRLAGDDEQQADQDEGQQAKQAQEQQAEQDEGQQAKQAQQEQLPPQQAQQEQLPPQQAQQQVQQQAQQVQQQQAQQQQVQQQAQQQQQQMPPQQAGQGQCMECAQGQQPQQEVMADDVLLDDMLTGPGGMDIELEPSPMDVGEVTLGPEDDVLRTLFAQDQGEQEQDQGEQAQQQQKQGMVRTARTIGTRPSGGVSKVGGAPSGKSSDVDKLSSLWASAPDVREAFGIPKT